MITSPPPRLTKREQLVDTALRLFAGGGYHAVGIDTVIAAAGVAKQTLYTHFPSKNALIAEVLRERDRRFRVSLEGFVDRYSEPLARLEAVFMWHRQWFTEPGFAGCMFINVAAEFHGEAVELQQLARAHKQAVERYLAGLLAPLVTQREAAGLAADFNLLLDGAIGVALVSGDAAAAERAWKMGRQLLASAQPGVVSPAR
jgi:AcrR family transcriptional regulator